MGGEDMSLKDNQGKYFVGRVGDFTKKKGWFLGHFADEALLKTGLVEVAWQDVSNTRSDVGDKHYHKEAVEVNIVLSGEAKLKINDEEVVARAGEFWVIWPGAVVSEFEAGEDTQLILIKAPSVAGDKYEVERGLDFECI
jgi:quercetin dioxygenase-like cupin family protein